MSRPTNSNSDSSSLFLGIPEIDRRFWKTLQPGHVHLIAVSDDVDKAAFAAEVSLYHVSRSVKTFELALGDELDVGNEQNTVFNHFFAQKSGVSASRFYPGYCTKSELKIITAAVDEIRNLHSQAAFWMPEANLNVINEKARAASQHFIDVSNTALELIIITGFEHLSARANHDRDPAAVAGQLKEMAIYYNVPVIIFASIPVPAGDSTSAPTADDVPWAGDVLPFCSFFSLLYADRGQIFCRVAKNLLGKSGIQAVRTLPAPVVPFFPTAEDIAAAAAAEQSGGAA